MVEGVKKLKSYERSTDVLEISSEQSRKQKDNLENCYRKLDGFLMKVANDVVAGETLKDQIAASRKER